MVAGRRRHYQCQACGARMLLDADALVAYAMQKAESQGTSPGQVGSPTSQSPRRWSTRQHGAASMTAFRCARLALHFLRAWFELAVLFPRLPQQRRAERVQAWCADFLRIARLHVRADGAAGDREPALLVANHVSWVDMVVLQSLRPTRFVAKSEVRAWPVIGAIATRCGTVYVERSRMRSTADVSARLRDLLLAGETVTVFPEGTTTDGTEVKVFRASLLQSAIEAQARVQPVGLRYVDAATGAPCRRIAYAGDDSLAASIWRTLRQPTGVHVRFGDAVDATRMERRQLAARLHALVVHLRHDPT